MKYARCFSPTILKNIRKARNLSQEQLAKEATFIGPRKVCTKTVSRWERGVDIPNAERLAAIADVLNVRMTHLFIRLESPII